MVENVVFANYDNTMMGLVFMSSVNDNKKVWTIGGKNHFI